MKLYLKVLLVILLLLALAGVGYLFSSRLTDTDGGTLVDLNTTNQLELVSVYFPNNQTDPNFTGCSTVYPVKRWISLPSTASESEKLQATLEQLFVGPTVEEIPEGYVSVFSKETGGILKNAFIQNQTAYVNLTDIRLLFPNVSASCGSADFLAEVEATANQFTGVDQVLFAINEDPETFYEWIQVGCSEENDECDAAPFEAQNSGTTATTRIVNMYVVALDDNGRNGELIGCGDSLVPLQREVSVTSSSTQAAMYAALSILLSNNHQTLEEGAYYNALYQSNLDIESVTVTNGVATVRLVGEIALSGVCDNPRFEAQLQQTVLQFSGVESAQFFVNGEILKDVVSGR